MEASRYLQVTFFWRDNGGTCGRFKAPFGEWAVTLCLDPR